MHFGIPVTSVARTIVDLAHELDADELERLVRETEFQKRLDVTAIRESLRWRRTPSLEALLDRVAPTQSRHEDRLLRLCERFGLPAPLTQQSLGGRTVDFLWPEARLVVEVDSWIAHGTRSAFQNDRTASNGLQLAGYVVLRFTDWISFVTRHGSRASSGVRSSGYLTATVGPGSSPETTRYEPASATRAA